MTIDPGRGGGPHIVVVDAYDGHLDYIAHEPEERAGASGLGLPWAELAALLGCRITLMTWDAWHAWETRPGSPFTWADVRPVTRPVPARPIRIPARPTVPGLTERPVPARDPELRTRLDESGPGPRSHGLLAGTDVFFWVSFCLRDVLIELSHDDPFDAVVLPAWGGLGWAAQLGRATGLAPGIDVPFIAVVTDLSAARHAANEEGEWTREATVRRQMEDVSIALADGVLVFGPRGERAALERRPPGALSPVLAPRRMDARVLERLDRAADATLANAALMPFLDEPQQAAAGALVTLDAVARLARRGTPLPAFTSSGPDCVFAPMWPRTFVEWWSGRGFVRDLVAAGQWRWQDARPEPDGQLALRLFPSAFELLPDVITELARGSAVLLSPAAAEGLAPGASLPGALLLESEPDADRLAGALGDLLEMGASSVDEARRALCGAVAAAHRDAARNDRLEQTASLLERALRRRLDPPDMGRTALMLLDRTRPPASVIASAETTRPAVDGDPASHRRRRTDRDEPAAVLRAGLSVVVTCHAMGDLVVETVRSVWASERMPDDVIVIDDGSQDAATGRALALLEEEAAGRALPLRIIRQDNRGLAAARNRGLEAVATTFVSFVDGDDLIEPAFFRLAVPLLERNPAVGGVGAWAFIFGSGVPEAGWFWNPALPELPSLLVENGVIVPCVMRTDTVRALRGYDTGQRYNYEDWALSIGMLAAGHPILLIPEYLMRYRTRDASMLRSLTDVQNQVMRERMLGRQRALVSRFGLELAMLTEDRRVRAVAATPQTPLRSLARSLLDAARAGPDAVRELLRRHKAP